MATQAKITSLDALESLRSHLIVFMAKARRALDNAGDEVRGTRQWLQHEQRVRWETEIRALSKKCEQAEQELLSAKLTGHREALITRQAVVRRYREALSEAQGKLRAVKQWGQSYDSIADPVVKRLDDLRHYLEHDIPKATAYLASVQKTLESYTDAPAPTNTPPAETAPPQP
ncbi:MAG: hypothetical protein WCO68_01240 [Verrucomicrobiota bacterium]